ncbi:MAG TPA: PLP-dependent aminotransferase family protein [Anaeromyxobacteraceae bacterium]|nr:PLP-dependent aminotransferase family protein [Anaeromyxobacteraceae bacterium]
MAARPAGSEPLLYERVAAEMGDLIERGTYRTGDRIPSIRGLARQRRVSINTVMEAYAQLENRRLVEARPQSGYYVACRLAEPAPAPDPRAARQGLAPAEVDLGRGPLEVMRRLADPGLVPLGRGAPNVELLPAERLARMLASEARRFRDESVSYAGRKGLKRLRTQIAQRSVAAGCRLGPDDLVVTSGCVEAVTLALQATCQPGDTVAVGSPVYYTFLNSIQWLGLKVLEIPSSAREGLSLPVLDYALRHHPVKVCLAISNFSNPLGSVMSDGHKEELVRLLARRDVPLVEDDVYGDLGFGPHRPRSTKAFDEKGLVLHCSSFSKTLAPGYRVGWMAPGRFQEKVERLKALFNIATASPTQLAVAEFLTSGGYDRHLRTVRRIYARNVAEMRAAVGRWFPAGTKVTRPEGGFVLWVELPGETDAFEVYQEALRRGIGVAPGSLFTIGDGFRSCLRLGAAHWSERVARAVRTVGSIAGAAAADPPRARKARPPREP